MRIILTTSLVILFAMSISLYANDALDLDGTNDYIQVNYSASLGLSTNATWEFWVKPDGAVANQMFLCNYSNYVGDGYYINYYEQKIVISQGIGSSLRQTLSESSPLSSGVWQHIAIVKSGSVVNIYLNGGDVTETAGAHIDIINAGSEPPIRIGVSAAIEQDYDGNMDEIRIWNTALSQSIIQDWMHQEITTDHPNYSNQVSDNLKAYYQMSDGSGTSITDNSSNSNTSTINGATWVTSTVPMIDLTSGYTTDIEAIWRSTGTSASGASDGITMQAGTQLTTGNFAVFGNNNTSGTSASDLPGGVSERSGRIWQVEESGTVLASVTIDISDATGNSVSAGTASNYKLLFRSSTSGNFSSAEDGDSKSGDAISFNSVALQDGYYAMGVTGDASLPVELSFFTTTSIRKDEITLIWATESEVENLGFILERRTGTGDRSTDWTEIANYITHPELQGQGSVTCRTDYCFTDNTVSNGNTYDYRLTDVSYNGVKEYHSMTLLGIKVVDLPAGFSIYDNHPNPFNPTTTISYDLPEQSLIKLKVFDIRGQEVTTLQNDLEPPGNYEVHWNGLDQSGNQVSTGVYFCRLSAGSYSKTIKMVYLR